MSYIIYTVDRITVCYNLVANRHKKSQTHFHLKVPSNEVMEKMLCGGNSCVLIYTKYLINA